MLPDRVSNAGPLTYESGALPIALRGPATLGKPDRKAELSTLLLLSYFVARYRNLGRNYSLGKV